MRSQEIKIRNLPILDTKPYSLRVKPVQILLLIIAVGIYLALQKTGVASTGTVLIILGLFALVLMPDRTLAQFLPAYMILYDNRMRDSCMLIYWDEIVSWSYEWHPGCDLLVITLVDGSTRTADMYSKRSVAKYMNLYAPNKEKKTVRNREGSRT